MLQAHSSNIAVTANTNIVFNNIDVETGCVALLSNGGTTIKLNRPGIYRVDFNAYGSSTEAGSIGAQLQVDGVNNNNQASSVATTSAGLPQALGFSTLIKVGRYCPCRGVSKTVNVVYTGSAGTLTLANIIVSKIA